MTCAGGSLLQLDFVALSSSAKVTSLPDSFYLWTAAACAPVQGATRFSLILLLFGTIIGDFALLADVGTRAVERLHAAHAAPPAWLVGHHGRVIMALLAICPVYPLCCLRRSVSCVCPECQAASHFPVAFSQS